MGVSSGKIISDGGNVSFGKVEKVMIFEVMIFE